MKESEKSPMQITAGEFTKVNEDNLDSGDVKEPKSHQQPSTSHFDDSSVDHNQNSPCNESLTKANGVNPQQSSAVGEAETSMATGK